MLKRIAFFPFLFVLFAILNPLVNNLDEMDPSLAIRPLIVALLIAALLLLLFRMVVKDWHYAGYLSFLCLFAFFTYGHLNNVLIERLPQAYTEYSPRVVLAGLVLVILALGLRRTWVRLGGSDRITPFLNLALAFAVLSQGVSGWRQLPDVHAKRMSNPGWYASKNRLPEIGAEVTLNCARSPDIYWIVLDGYGRADVLQEMYGVNNGPFIASLERIGFYVAGRSHSNYIQTVYSIPSALNMGYVAPRPAGVSGYDYFPALMAENQLMALLRQCGYQMVAFETPFFFTNFPDADVYIRYGTDLNEFEGLLLTSTPLDLLLKEADLEPLERSHAAHRDRVRFVFERLAQFPAVPGPKLVIAHIVSPHPPFVFDAQGLPVQPNRSYTMVDGSHYRGSWREYREGYAAQVQHVNQLLEHTVSEIIRRSPTPPVIVVQGDHGPGGFLEWGSPRQSCLWERISILNAYYLPHDGSEQLEPDTSPVNSFRIVLNAYFGADLELLPDEAYFTSDQPGGSFIPVTDRRESRANCGQGPPPPS